MQGARSQAALVGKEGFKVPKGGIRGLKGLRVQRGLRVRNVLMGLKGS